MVFVDWIILNSSDSCGFVWDRLIIVSQFLVNEKKGSSVSISDLNLYWFVKLVKNQKIDK